MRIFMMITILGGIRGLKNNGNMNQMTPADNSKGAENSKGADNNGKMNQMTLAAGIEELDNQIRITEEKIALLLLELTKTAQLEAEDGTAPADEGFKKE
eukprot:GHVP01050667.1.p1 GENE.GHVP01050667.1~~GHVP01050667.1.p1  ORF type:complete len:114 (+),score=21.85 GHVP01050667.1:46-342(+)